MIHRAIYHSDAVGKAGTGLISVAHILGVSDRNNRRDHLTGLLVAHEGRFLQVIEGARADIERLLARLAHDPRHRDMRLLTLEPVTERRFPHWSMAQAAITPRLDSVIADRSLDGLDAAQALALLEAAAAQIPLPEAAA